jgi:hypothetical protein
MQKPDNKRVVDEGTGEVVENKGARMTRLFESRVRPRRVPDREELGYTPAVLVRVATKGLTAYVKWKSAEAIENKEGTSEVGLHNWAEPERKDFGFKDVTRKFL